ncbi:MAG: hypothetical protein A2498_09710 [Lentisphaerae bacterium RIFOXYC12_FULL_60_16]|nr:MAG: hypothetical protein A2498_09710 [Lentisphaerae bacterium RIFOXYC12_FULL_60_16]OGV78491.1 MAG: hypothetical protein A2340_07565 [Lentisphaerae bacterium RIFOXYB12_FULL_60_10]
MNARSGIRAWLELVRIPNLLTVPGDPLAGYLLAGGGLTRDGASGIAVIMVVAVCLYAAGLIFNDVADVGEDCRSRPSRPIPGGRIRRSTAGWAGTLLMVLAVLAAGRISPDTGWVALVLAGLVLLYDFGSRRIPLIGFINMGMCRGASVMLGAACAGGTWLTPAPMLAAGTMVVYVAGVTVLASTETRSHRPSWLRWVPLGALLVWLAGIPVALPQASPLAAVLALVMVWNTLRAVQPLGAAVEGGRVAVSIGQLVRGLLLVQATWCAAVGGRGLVAAGVLTALWCVAGWLGRRFYSS